jgi:hypothetical protein
MVEQMKNVLFLKAVTLDGVRHELPLVKAHIKGYSTKKGTFVAEHQDSRKESGKDDKDGDDDSGAPKEGEEGYSEHKEYGVYHKKGSKVRDNYGKTHEVSSHQGADVLTTKGEHFHPTKLHPVK